VGVEHRHLVDLEQRVLACACGACATLFDREGACGGRFRTVPERYVGDPQWRPTPEAGKALAALDVRGGLAFFVRRCGAGPVLAVRPGPAGPVESEVEPGLWQAAFAGAAPARLLVDDVEALLLWSDTGRARCALVPLDAAYALLAALRPLWREPDGGPAARARVTAFLADLDRRAVPVPATARWGTPA
jgi:hypothetical protein